MSSTVPRRPHGGGYMPEEEQHSITPVRRPHGGGFMPEEAGVRPAILPARDLNELAAIPPHHEMPAASNGATAGYVVSEMPTYERPIELGHNSQSRSPPRRDTQRVPITPEKKVNGVQLRSSPPVMPLEIRKNNPSPHTDDSISKASNPWKTTTQSSNTIKHAETDLEKAMREEIVEFLPSARAPTYSNYLSDPTSTRIRHPQKGGWNASSTGSNFRWKKHPHIFKHPNVKAANRTRYRHRDAMSRVKERPSAERYLHSASGKLKKLMVQTVDQLYHAPGQQHSWRRTYLRKIGPYILRAAYWPIKTIPVSHKDWTHEDKVTIAVRWIPACLALFFVLPLPKQTAEVASGGGYFPFPYKYWGACKVARNPREDVRPSRAIHWNASTEELKSERILRPTYIMVLKNPDSQEMSGYIRIKDADWDAQQDDENMKSLPYVFVAYTADHFTQDPADMKALLQIAEKATRRAGLSAFWIGCSCMPDPANVEEDVYRINDVIRGAYSLVIAVCQKRGDDKPRDTASLLWEWGSRMWTFPEALLSPNDQKVEIYTRGSDLNRPWVISKKDLPARAWADADLARQLMDHFQGTLTLSRLELVNIAMKCLHARRTDTYLKGDMAYALMGLLRRRPMIDRTDSEFQALARLSLANDSDLLLERLICILPKKLDQNWIKAEDAWDVNLWDIYPYCQVAGVGDKDTVVLDGCRAASIKWDTFCPVATMRKVSWKRWMARLLVRISPVLIIIGIALAAAVPVSTPSGFGFAAPQVANPYAAPAGILLTIGLVTWLASPYLVRVIYGGKLWDQQAWLFGFEGYVDIGTVESLIFGYNMKRLNWSTCGSNLSRHSVNSWKEWVGRDPTDEPEIAQLVEEAKRAKLGEQRIFTIVDTFTMTVTLIQAARPPVMVLLCASEGGNQRAVMCSYDWRSATLYKETVTRMETQVLGRMRRIGRVNFGFYRPEDTLGTTAENIYQSES